MSCTTGLIFLATSASLSMTQEAHCTCGFSFQIYAISSFMQLAICIAVSVQTGFPVQTVITKEHVNNIKKCFQMVVYAFLQVCKCC